MYLGPLPCDFSENEIWMARRLIPIIERKNALPDGSAERAFCVRMIDGFRTNEEAGPLIETLDPIAWGS